MNFESRANTDVVIRYKNCYVLREGHLILDDIWVREGRVIDPMELFYKERKMADITIECNRYIASPGFIDIQLNGGFKYDFSSFSNPNEAEKGLQFVSKELLEYGVTAYCPTLVSCSKEYYNMILPIMKKKKGGIDGAAILGVHLEGPFLNKEKKGAHRLENIRDRMSKEEVMDVYGESLDNACIITLAPELEGCLETLPWLREQGVVISLGHSMANLQKAKEAINKGATLITHLFNAMLPFHHRDPGIVGLLTSLDLPRDIYYSMISDGHHTDMTVQRIAYNANPNGVVLITDGIKAMGLPPGHYNLGDMIIDVTDNISYLAGTQTLAGSVATLDECIRCFIQATDCSLASALEAASLHPAKVLEGIGYPADGKRLPSRGHLGVGAPADVTFLTPLSDKTSPLRVVATVIAGDIVYKATDCTMYEILN